MTDKFKKYKNNIIKSDLRIIDALNQLDVLDIKTLLVTHNNQYLGTITDGDIRRGLLNNIKLDEPVKTVTNTESTFISYKDYQNHHHHSHFGSLDLIPIIKSNKIFDVIINGTKLKKDGKKIKKDISRLCEVVIMAGGRGERMSPLTQLIPKPLIPYKDKTLIEHVMYNFLKFNQSNFQISVHYKADAIIDYFNKKESPFNISYIREKSPMGTIGALSKIANKVEKDIFVSNCDSLIDLDFHDMYQFHSKNKFDLTIAACKDIINIPYGVCAVNNDFSLKSIIEKPQINHLINSGLYLINSDALKLIPKNKRFNATDLINKCHQKEMSVGVYPFSKDLWLDVGILSDYLAIL